MQSPRTEEVASDKKHPSKNTRSYRTGRDCKAILHKRSRAQLAPTEDSRAQLAPTEEVASTTRSYRRLASDKKHPSKNTRSYRRGREHNSLLQKTREHSSLLQKSREHSSLLQNRRDYKAILPICFLYTAEGGEMAVRCGDVSAESTGRNGLLHACK